MCLVCTMSTEYWKLYSLFRVYISLVSAFAIFTKLVLWFMQLRILSIKDDIATLVWQMGEYLISLQKYTSQEFISLIADVLFLLILHL